MEDIKENMAVEIVSINVVEKNQGKNPRKFTIDGQTLDKAFAVYFRDYVNRYKYCDTNFLLVDDAIKEKYNDWIGDISNYAANGGDMY